MLAPLLNIIFSEECRVVKRPLPDKLTEIHRHAPRKTNVCLSCLDEHCL